MISIYALRALPRTLAEISRSEGLRGAVPAHPSMGGSSEGSQPGKDLVIPAMGIKSRFNSPFCSSLPLSPLCRVGVGVFHSLVTCLPFCSAAGL